MTEPFGDLQQTWPRPANPRPVTLIGAGGIVRDAHLPAYRALGLPVAGIHDPNRPRAETLARDFGLPRVFGSLDEAVEATGTAGVYDVAVPPGAILGVIERLPRGACVLIQKPLGESLDEAVAIVTEAGARGMTAATNFQLRFTPSILAITDAARRGLFGEITEVEVHLAVRMPWELWPFMEDLSAVEIPLHSIHYIDWIRQLLGEPRGVWARSVGHPDHPGLADARSTVILDHGDRVRVALSLNHTFAYGPRHTEAAIRVEGTGGAAHLTVGYLLDYRRPAPERLEMIRRGGDWTAVPLAGERAPDAFGAVMCNLQRHAAGEDATLVTDIADGLKTMAVVEAALTSSRQGGVAPRQM